VPRSVSAGAATRVTREPALGYRFDGRHLSSWVPAASHVEVAGRIVGVGSQGRRGAVVEVTLRPFGRLRPAALEAVASEAADLARCVGAERATTRLG
jgi:hypothetical protein